MGCILPEVKALREDMRKIDISALRDP